MSQHTLPGLLRSSSEAGPARASTHDLALCPAQPMPPSWGSSEKQLTATCWATQAVPSSQKGLGEVQLPFKAACALGRETLPSP